MKIILASASPRRKKLLEQAGIYAEVSPAEVEERTSEEQPEKVVLALSRIKCEAAARQSFESAVFIGADTVVSAGGKILGKPKDSREAARMIKSIEGRRHEVYTGVTMLRKEAGKWVREESFYVCTEIFIYPMTDQEIKEYADSGDGLDKAGGYGIQGEFAKYVRKISGDYNNVVGLPIAELYHRLKAWNI